MNDTSNNHRITLGRSGLEVSPICFGTWQLSPAFWGPPDEEEITRAVRRAYELGINFYDTANAYGDGFAETVLGRALAELPRDQVVVATKVDRLKEAQLEEALALLRERLALPPGQPIRFSSKTGEGRRELWDHVQDVCTRKQSG